MIYALAIVWFVVGHLIRDGEPATGSTHLARFMGGIACAIGGACIHASLYLAIMIWAGFYVDMKHGEGQGGATLSDASFLAISGLTSLLPLALYLDHTYIILVGLSKIPIWFGAWWLQRKTGWNFYPTRWAAMAFGAVVGGLVVVIA